MSHRICTKLLGHHCCRRVYLLDSRVGLSWPFAFAPVTLLSKPTPGFMRTSVFMLFVCISLSSYSLQYGHFYTPDILLPFSPIFTTAETPEYSPLPYHRQMTPFYSTLMPTIGVRRIKQQSFPLGCFQSWMHYLLFDSMQNYGVKRWDANSNLQCNIQHTMTLVFFAVVIYECIDLRLSLISVKISCIQEMKAT